MGAFVDYPSNIFAGLNDTPQTIVTANTNVLWVTTISVCNRGPAPIRFNLQKVRTQGTSLKASCYAGTTINLIATYNNGVSGVGATLTNSGTLAAFSIDGVSPALNARVLIKNQSFTFQNGIYTVTTIGSGSIAWVLTRATNYNSVATIKNGDLVPITNGTVNTNTNWLQTSSVTTIGTSPIVFALNPSTTIYSRNEFEIEPYDTVNIIDKTGVIQLEYNLTPFVSDILVCFSNGYTQVFDCDVGYARLNELP